MQALVRSRSLWWGVSAEVWGHHGSDEILWTVSAVGKAIGDSEVLDRLRVNKVAVVGTMEVVDW